MSEDNVVQFVPGLRSERRLREKGLDANKAYSVYDLWNSFADMDTAPSEYVAPTDDCA